MSPSCVDIIHNQSPCSLAAISHLINPSRVALSNERKRKKKRGQKGTTIKHLTLSPIASLSNAKATGSDQKNFTRGN